VRKDTRCNQLLLKHKRRRTHIECGAGGKTNILNQRVEVAKGIAVDRGTR
jgi:trans-aconitate methyltransferase